MTIGIVNDNLEIIVPLVIAGADGAERKLECRLATGYAGDLMLPSDQIAALGLPQTGAGAVGYPPGNPTEVPIHQADVLWCGEKRTIAVHAWGQRPVLGTGLLWGYRMSVRVTPGSPLVIEPL